MKKCKKDPLLYFPYNINDFNCNMERGFFLCLSKGKIQMVILV